MKSRITLNWGRVGQAIGLLLVVAYVTTLCANFLTQIVWKDSDDIIGFPAEKVKVKVVDEGQVATTTVISKISTENVVVVRKKPKYPPISFTVELTPTETTPKIHFLESKVTESKNVENQIGDMDHTPVASAADASDVTAKPDLTTLATNPPPPRVQSKTKMLSTKMKYTSPWTWTCGKEDQKCHRILRRKGQAYSSLENCWLKCGGLENIWPKPRAFVGENFVGKRSIPFCLKNFILKKVEVKGQSEAKESEVTDLATNAFSIMKHNLKLLLPSEYDSVEESSEIVSVSIKIQSDDSQLSLLTDEAYALKTTQKKAGNLNILISGETFYGIRHGLETLSQMIVFDEGSNSLQILKEVKLTDAPAFPYRGLMIDTARNFIPIGSLERMVDGMSFNKLNVLHWHVTDSNSFPLFCPSFPQMTNYGAYSKDAVYLPKQVKDFVNYARVRGVKVIPELDAPAHAGNGWQWGDEDNGFGQLALCVNEEPFNGKCGQPPCGQLNPVNPKVYEVLGGIYSDMLSMFDSDMFHMGGDEVTYECWRTEEIKGFIDQNNFTGFINLRRFFQAQAYEMLDKAARKNSKETPVPILWTSDLTVALSRMNQSHREILPTQYIIQSWEEAISQRSNIKKLLKANYPLIVSDLSYFYLDLGGGSWLGKNHDWRYINWQAVYKFDFEEHGYNTTNVVYNSRFGDIPQILGAEATLWTEKVNENTMEAKLWPRGAALGERLWFNPSPEETNSTLLYARLLRQNERMRQRGLHVNARQPKSCILINGNCENEKDPEP